jgi:hypothetical protein
MGAVVERRQRLVCQRLRQVGKRLTNRHRALCCQLLLLQFQVLDLSCLAEQIIRRRAETKCVVVYLFKVM